MYTETNVQTKKCKIFPLTRIVKLLTFDNVMSIDTTLSKVDDFYNGALWENSVSFCWIPLKFNP